MKQPASNLRGGFLDPCSAFHMLDYLRTHLAIATQASRRRARLMFLVVVGAQQESKLYLLEDAAQQAGHPIEDRAVLLVAVNVCDFRSRLVGLQVMLVESSTSGSGTLVQRAPCALSSQ